MTIMGNSVSTSRAVEELMASKDDCRCPSVIFESIGQADMRGEGPPSARS